MTGVQGAELIKNAGGERLRIRIPGDGPPEYKRVEVVIQFGERAER